MLKTLTPFEWLLKSETQQIHCPQVFLDDWNDRERPLFDGSGTLTVPGAGEISFRLDAIPRDIKDAIVALRRAVEEPYEPSTAMRLRCVDYSGTAWNAGWVRPRVGESQGGYWQLFGQSGALSTHVQEREPKSGVELAFWPSPDVPFSEVMTTTAHLGETQLGRRTRGGRHQMEVLGSQIEAATQPWANELWISATTSEELRHPYLGNWLSEPLRALRGQLIFPRLVARNFADGRAAVSLRIAPALRPSMGGCVSQLRSQAPSEFWSFYSHYLKHVACHRTKDGRPEFEANGLTRLHDEVVQARKAGSHWVIALCVASAIEGIVKLDPAFKTTPADFTAAELKPAGLLVASLKPEALRSRVQGSIAQLERASPSKYLSSLVDKGLVTKEQLQAWNRVRNQVAHGNLFEPWGTEAEHEQLTSLVELFYQLTSLRIGYLA